MAVAFLMTTAELQQALYRVLHVLQPTVFHLAALHPTRPHGIVGGIVWACSMGVPVCPFWGGARPEATCASLTSLACMRCRCCHCSAGCSDAVASRRCRCGGGWRWCGCVR